MLESKSFSENISSYNYKFSRIHPYHKETSNETETFKDMVWEFRVEIKCLALELHLGEGNIQGQGDGKRHLSAIIKNDIVNALFSSQFRYFVNA